MFFAILLELYSNSRYNKGQGVFAILRYIYEIIDNIFSEQTLMLDSSGYHRWKIQSCWKSHSCSKFSYKTRGRIELFLGPENICHKFSLLKDEWTFGFVRHPQQVIVVCYLWSCETTHFSFFKVCRRSKL